MTWFLNFNLSLGVKMTKKIQERRRSVRHKVEFLVSAYKAEKLVIRKTHVQDISNIGCMIVAHHESTLHIGDLVVLQIEDLFLKRKFGFCLDPIKAVVTRVTQEEHIQVGFEFLDVSEKNKIFINYIVEYGPLLKEFPQSWQFLK